MKRFVLGAALLVLVVASGVIGFNWVNTETSVSTTIQQSAYAIDVSWIPTVNDFLEEAKPYPDTEPFNYLLAMQHIYLWENGTRQIVTWAGRNDAFCSYMENLLLQVNRHLTLNVTEEFMDELLSTDRAVELEYRFPTNSTLFENTISVYFTLQDNLNRGHQGTIFVRQLTQQVDLPDKLSAWVIS